MTSPAPALGKSMGSGAAGSAFTDLLSRFLEYSRESADPNHALHLARALGQYFAFCIVGVAWIPSTEIADDLEDLGELFQPCGASWSPPATAIALSNEEIQSLIATQRSRVKIYKVLGMETGLSYDDQEPWIFVLSRAKDQHGGTLGSGTLWIAVRRAGEIDEARAIWSAMFERVVLLRLWLSHLAILHATFVAAHSSSAYGAAISSKIRTFGEKVGMTPDERVAEATRLVRSLVAAWAPASAGHYLALAHDVLESVVQALLGNGVDLNDDRIASCAGGALELITMARRLMSEGRTVGPPSPVLERLEALCRMLSVVVEDKEPDSLNGASTQSQRASGEGDRDLMDLELIADWTALHQYARCRSGVREEESPERPRKVWYPRAESTMANLALFLRGHFRSTTEVAYLPAWLRLWFCHRLLGQVGPPDGGDAGNRWRFYEHLAYVVRESLRAFVFGPRTEYLFRPAELVVALRTVVEQHAVGVLRLPSDQDIRGLLQEMSSMQGDVGYMFVAGHLQHVLEVYIAGQFVCDLETEAEVGSGDLWTIEQILASRSAWKPGRLPTGEFRRAFSLAALLHDASRLLLPRWRPGAERWERVDRSITRGLAGVEDGFLAALATLMEDCSKELQAEGYFDAAAEPAVSQWVRSRIERREVDFPLVSAWFLHRLSQKVHGLQGDTLRQAVRAVLFHQMVTQPIAVDRDPAAALLVFCDQIFAWDATKLWATPAETGHSFQAIAAEIRPQPAPFKNIELTGVKVEESAVAPGGPDKPLRFVLQRTCKQDHWPQLEILLPEVELGDPTVHRIWMSLAQNLSRIAPSSKYRWGPSVRVRARVLERSGRQRLSTFRLLEEIANQDHSPLRIPLQQFLRAVELSWQQGPDRAEESLEFKPLARALHREDLTYIFPELERLEKETLSRG